MKSLYINRYAARAAQMCLCFDFAESIFNEIQIGERCRDLLLAGMIYLNF